MTEQAAIPSGIVSLQLGEGPVWNPAKNQLSIVDIFARRVHLFDIQDGAIIATGGFDCEGDVGAALPTSDGGFVLCLNTGIFFRDPSGAIAKICDLPVRGSEFRCNDAKLGPDGKLWVGIMDYDASAGQGSLWRIGRDGQCQMLLDNLTIPNGLDWWKDEFWFVDGPAEQISLHKWSELGLESTSRKIQTNGTPDGLTIDSNGEIWLSLWGEGRVDHFDSSGIVIESVSVASPHSTSLCFAGEKLDTLVMTSAKYAMRAEDLQSFQNAGDLFSFQTNSRGRASNFDFN
jgi:sugar lactone lactonase YvrE